MSRGETAPASAHDPLVPDPRSLRRPRGIAALAIFFGLGCLISLTSAVALLFPGGLLEPMWRLNPRAREAFAGMGPWAIALLLPVSAACGAAGLGLWRRRRWGLLVAIAVLTINLLGDVVNTVLGIEPRAAFGIPIAAALLLYLVSRRVRAHFDFGPGLPASR
jgi:hypothetical protein